MGDLMHELRATCFFCAAEQTFEIDPDGWGDLPGDFENALCPAHAVVKEFLRATCPGCVEGWPDCSLERAFAYSKLSEGATRLTIGDFAKIRQGICPRRTNGTLGMTITDAGAIPHRIDLSERASAESGDAMARAIESYMAEWGTGKTSQRP